MARRYDFISLLTSKNGVIHVLLTTNIDRHSVLARKAGRQHTPTPASLLNYHWAKLKASVGRAALLRLPGCINIKLRPASRRASVGSGSLAKRLMLVDRLL